MPIEIGAPEAREQEEIQIESLLFDESGKLTLEGEIIGDFLESVDYDALFEDADVQEFIDDENALYFVEGEDGEPKFLTKEEEIEAHEDVEEAEIEVVPGEVAVQAIDMDDMFAMFEYYVQNEMPTTTMEDKARKAAALYMLGEEALEEAPFKKGDFRKLRAKGPGGKDAVTRMMIAMLGKEAIKRVGKGKGYKGGGYAKDSGYAPGTPGGIKRYEKMRKKTGGGEGKGAGKKSASLAKKAIAKFLGSKPEKKGAKKKAAMKPKKKISAKAMGAKKGGAKKALAASIEQPRRYHGLNEGASLARGVLGCLRSRSLVEDKQPKEPAAK